MRGRSCSEILMAKTTFRISLFHLCAAAITFSLPSEQALAQSAPMLSQYGPAVVYDDIPGVLFFIGDVRDGDYFPMRRAIRQENIHTIVLSSPGGSVWEGLRIAGLVNDLSLTTYIPEHALCASACSYIFFAGATRIVDGRLGVHQFYPQTNAMPSDHRSTQFTVSEILGFLNEFETPPFVYEFMFQAEDMYFFHSDAKEDLERGGGDHLSPAIMDLLDRRLLDTYAYFDQAPPIQPVQPPVEVVTLPEVATPDQHTDAPSRELPQILPDQFLSASHCLWAIGQIQEQGKISFTPGFAYQFSEDFDLVVLDQIAQVLKGCVRWVFEIEVHAFDAGSSLENQRTSELRANFILRRLQALGVPLQNLTARGYGDTRPLQQSAPTENAALDTRVVFAFSGAIPVDLEERDTSHNSPNTRTQLPRPVPRPELPADAVRYGVTGLSQDDLNFIRLQIAQWTNDVSLLDFIETEDPFYFYGDVANYIQNLLGLEAGLASVDGRHVLDALPTGYLPPAYFERVYPEYLQNVRRIGEWDFYSTDDFCAIRSISKSTSSNLLQFVPEIHLLHRRGGQDAALAWNFPFPQSFDVADNVYVAIDGRPIPIEVYNTTIGPVQLDDGLSTELTRSMRSGLLMTIVGTNRLTREPLTVEFSLFGFTSTFNYMLEVCEAPALEAWIR